MFEPDVLKSADLLVRHSGGKVSTALTKAIEQDEIMNTDAKVSKKTT